MAANNKRPTSSGFFETMDSSASGLGADGAPLVPKVTAPETAIVYCEGCFGSDAGEMTHALVRGSERYKLLSIIDSEKAEQDAGEVLDGKRSGLAIYRDLGTALAQASGKPAYLVFGMTAAGDELSQAERRVLLRAIAYKINVACESHELLNEDPEFAAACEKSAVVIREV